MAEYKDREHFIPVRKSELVDALCTDKTLPNAEREPFRQFCRLVSAVFHYEYYQRLEDLKNAYAPFDPDADTKPLVQLAPEERQRQLDKLFADFVWLMERCNYRHLSREHIETAMQKASDWGLNMHVDFANFDRLEVFVRGDSTGKRSRRRLRNLLRLEEVQLPVYQRLILIAKLRPSKRLRRDLDTSNVYVKVFKDIPKLDVEMLLPGAEIRMPGLQRGKLGASLLSTVGFLGYKIIGEFSQLTLANPLTFWAPFSLVFGYGYRQYYGFQQARKNYSMMLTESLYFQNLDNNAGVLTRLLDEAEEQECREAILAYYYLWRHAGDQGWTSAALDDYVELDLERIANLKVDFEIDDALAKLERLRIVEKTGDRYRAVPLQRALEVLDYAWDNYFQYNVEAAPKTVRANA